MRRYSSMLRFCRSSEIPALLRRRPELVPAAVEELLRLEDPFLAIGRSVRDDTELGDHRITGEKVLISWASANRDEGRVPRPRRLPPRPGAQPPHRVRRRPPPVRGARTWPDSTCASRARDRRARRPHVAGTEDTLPFHTAFNWSPLALPLGFTPGQPAGQMR